MSIASYERNRARRVTGPHLPVCFPAALEQVSPYGYRPNVYRNYRDFSDWWDTLKVEKRVSQPYKLIYEDMLNDLLRPLGGLACEDVTFARAQNPLGWMRVVKRMLREDLLVTADIRYGISIHTCHTVGILPTPHEDYVTLVSTHVPKPLEGIVPLQRVAERMYVVPPMYKPSERFPFNGTNVVALPTA